MISCLSKAAALNIVTVFIDYDQQFLGREGRIIVLGVIFRLETSPVLYDFIYTVVYVCFPRCYLFY